MLSKTLILLFLAAMALGSNQEQTISCDIVVIGGGSAGFGAAYLPPGTTILVN